MRVLYLHQYFNTPNMSGSTRSYEMAQRLVKSGHQVTMITSDRTNQHNDTDWYVTDEAGIQVHWLRIPYSNRMSYGERIRAFFRFAWKSATRAASLPADIVFATSTPLTIAIPGIVAKLWQRVPMVFEVRDLWPDLPIAVGALRDPISRGLARLLERIAYKASAHVIALSPGMAAGVMQRGIPESRITVIPNSCDVELFDVPPQQGDAVRRRLGLQAGQPLVVYTGTFGLINGVGYLVRVAQALQTIAPDVRFLLVGKGAEREKVTQLSQELGVLDRNLWIWDPVSKAKIPNILAAATLATSTVIPLEPLWNNSANKFFDALAAGKPVAINYGGWQADVLQESGAGIVMPPEDPKEAARMLAEFLQDPGRVGRASEASRRLAYEVFNRDLLYAPLEQVLQEAAQGA